MSKQETQLNRIEVLAHALEQGREQFTEIMKEIASFPDFAVDEIYDLQTDWDLQPLPTDAGGVQMRMDPVGDAAAAGGAEQAADRIGAGDNLEYMVWLLRERKMAGKIQLIYVDPPFFTGAKYLASVQITGKDGKKSPVLKVGAYEDKWNHDLGTYLKMLAVRFYLMRELLSETGCLWVHLDWHGSHYVKMMLDEIFGEELFINEVAWTYKSGGASKRSFARKHDTLLFYGKSKEYKFHPLKEKSYNREFKPYHFNGVEEFEDRIGWYTMVNMKDVWNIDMVGRTSAERMGYATQKPEKLLERIVEACSDPGDLCADFFAGTGTLGAVCQREGRPWIMCDEGDTAIASQIQRMAKGAAEGGRTFLVERPVRPYELRPRTTVQVKEQEGFLVLRRCQPDLTQVREQDRQTVMEYINENSLDLVAFWSVDPDYDGSTHIARRLMPGNDTAALPEAVIRGSSTEAHRRISIVGYDLFGGRFEAGFEPDGRIENI